MPRSVLRSYACLCGGILTAAFFIGPEVLIAGVVAMIASVIVLNRLSGRFW
ncbi:MAG: hypothetical protein ACYTG0_46370 [Planctomycetota bacterium]|jgi:hypothetical protein